MAEKNIIPNLEAKASAGTKYSPETMAGEIPAVYQTGTQDRYHTTNKGRRNHRNRVDRRKRSKHSRRFYLGSGTGSAIPDNPGRV